MVQNNYFESLISCLLQYEVIINDTEISDIVVEQPLQKVDDRNVFSFHVNFKYDQIEFKSTGEGGTKEEAKKNASRGALIDFFFYLKNKNPVLTLETFGLTKQDENEYIRNQQSNTKPKQKQARSYPSNDNESAEKSSNKLDNPATEKHKLDSPKNESNGTRSSILNDLLFKFKLNVSSDLNNLNDNNLDLMGIVNEMIRKTSIPNDRFKQSPFALDSKLDFEEYWFKNRLVVREILKEESKFLYRYLIDKIQQMLPLLTYVVESKLDSLCSQMIRTSSIIYNGKECFKVSYCAGFDERGADEKCAKNMFICLKANVPKKD